MREPDPEILTVKRPYGDDAIIVRPFGCEFAFVKPDSEPIQLNNVSYCKPVQLLQRLGYAAGFDGGALEIRSPVFYRIEDAVKYWEKLSKLVHDELGLVSLPEEQEGCGGLHVTIDAPILDGRPSCFSNSLLLSTAMRNLFIGLNERLDDDNATNPPMSIALDGVLSGVGLEEFKMIGHNCLGHVFRARLSTFVPSIEHRYFRAPSNSEELETSLTMAHAVQNFAYESLFFFWAGPLSRSFRCELPNHSVTYTSRKEKFLETCELLVPGKKEVFKNFLFALDISKREWDKRIKGKDNRLDD